MKRTQIIQLNDKKIFFCDLKGIEKEEILDVSKETWSIISADIQKGEKVNFLIDITDVQIPPNIMEEISALAELHKNEINKEGVLGIHGFKRTLLNMYGWAKGSQLKAFEDRELAINWLAS